METKSDDHAGWHYAACPSCTAKWFAPFRPVQCPRCGTLVKHSERRMPPWIKHIKTSCPPEGE